MVIPLRVIFGVQKHETLTRALEDVDNLIASLEEFAGFVFQPWPTVIGIVSGIPVCGLTFRCIRHSIRIAPHRVLPIGARPDQDDRTCLSSLRSTHPRLRRRVSRELPASLSKYVRWAGGAARRGCSSRARSDAWCSGQPGGARPSFFGCSTLESGKCIHSNVLRPLADSGAGVRVEVAKNSKWGVFNHLAFVIAEAAFETLRREST